MNTPTSNNIYIVDNPVEGRYVPRTEILRRLYQGMCTSTYVIIESDDGEVMLVKREDVMDTD